MDLGFRTVGVELGGTKLVTAVGSKTGRALLARFATPTGDDPADLFRRLRDWWSTLSPQYRNVAGFGVGSFGPVQLDRRSPLFGHVTTTPKKGWQTTDVLGQLRAIFGDAPSAFDTDCNAALVGETTWGAGEGLSDVLYVTMGTGIGCGALVNGRPLRGLIHPEAGHLLLPRVAGDGYAGACPYHGACWEGLCSGPAIRARTGVPAEDLPADHPAWALAAEYTGAALANLVYAYSPRRVIVGGSVRKGGRLGEGRWFDLVRRHVLAKLNGYLRAPEFTPEGITNYVVPPSLGDDAGVLGAIALAQQALSETSRPTEFC